MEEIRRSYRRLAFRFHPDKNPDDEQAAGHFREITEAYETLSNVAKRLEYDCAYGFRSRQHPVATAPHMILQEATRLRKYVYAMNQFSMDQQALEYHLNRLLSDRNVELLHEFNHRTLNRQIIKDLIDASRHLKYPLLLKVLERMKILASGDMASLQVVEEYRTQRYQRNQWEKQLPYVVFFITILLCLLLYFAGSS